MFDWTIQEFKRLEPGGQVPLASNDADEERTPQRFRMQPKMGLRKLIERGVDILQHRDGGTIDRPMKTTIPEYFSSVAISNAP